MRRDRVDRLAFDAAPQGAAGRPETFSALHSGLQRVVYPEAAGDNQSVGEWLSLVEHLVRDQGVGGSNPLSPTILGFWPYSRSNQRAFCM